ncbi:MAG: MFS transporter [Chloroflexi bacterium]|nr:MFS transporter [Chloroflexota bacterium]
MTSSRYRWVVVAIFFAFMLLHQADKLLIGPLNDSIRETFGIDRAQMGTVGTAALFVAAIFYPLWGYLYDRYARAKLVALASFIWGATTSLGAIAPNFGTFFVARGATGIDDSSYPGIYSLISDYFGPGMRGKVNGLLQLTAPVGYMVGLVLAQALGPTLGWRNVFLITGGLGLVVAVVIFFGVREVPRGKAEPELESLEQIAVHKFDWKVAVGLLRKPALFPLFAQGFFGVFPLQVITFWFFDYLENERGYDQGAIFAIMAAAVLVMAGGAFFGGFLGDMLFKRTLRGRLLVSFTGVVMATILLFLALNVPTENIGLFAALLISASLFVLFSGPNVVSTVHDITLPEVRSTALSVQYFVENIGSALAPAIVGFLAVQSTLSSAILTVSMSTYVLCALFLALAVYLAPRDMAALRAQMRERAQESAQLSAHS